MLLRDNDMALFLYSPCLTTPPPPATPRPRGRRWSLRQTAAMHNDAAVKAQAKGSRTSEGCLWSRFAESRCRRGQLSWVRTILNEGGRGGGGGWWRWWRWEEAVSLHFLMPTQTTAALNSGMTIVPGEAPSGLVAPLISRRVSAAGRAGDRTHSRTHQGV